MTTQYQQNIPTGLVNLDVDYQNLQNNFSQLDTSFGVNHIKFSVAPNNGKHTFVEMPISTVIPSPLTGSEGTLYTKTANAASQLFYTPDNSTNEYQLTRTISASFGTFSSATGWTYLPGGLLMQWGQATSVGTSLPNTTVIFPVAFTNPSYSVNCTIITTADSRFFVEIYDISTSQFRAVTRDSGGSKTSGILFSWMAIGK